MRKIYLMPYECEECKEQFEGDADTEYLVCPKCGSQRVNIISEEEIQK